METNLLPKIKQQISELLSNYISNNQEKLDSLVNSIGLQVKSYLKEEQYTTSKDIAKKTKELFILSSDNESLKQKVADSQNKIRRLNEKVSQKQKSIVNLMNENQRQKKQQEQIFDQKVNILKKQISQLQTKKLQGQNKYKNEISDLKRINKQQIVNAILRQQLMAKNSIQRLQQEYSQQKRTLIQTQNKQRSDLIKKYEYKMQDLRDQHQKQTFKHATQHSQSREKDKKIRSNLQNQLFTAQNSIKCLQGQLSKQKTGHQKYKRLAQSLSAQLQDFHSKHQSQIEQGQRRFKQASQEHSKVSRKLKGQVRKLQQLFQSTIRQKDLIFEETTGTMKNQHTIQIQSLKNNLMEQRQIALNRTETKHYNEVQKLNEQLYSRQNEFLELNQAYKTVQSQYEQKISNLVTEYQQSIQSIKNRNDYEINLEGRASRKSVQVIQRKYRLEVKSLGKQYEEMREELTRKITQERITVTNKLTTQCQAKINDIKINNELAIKQKLMEFDRKSKGYEKKLAEAEKRRMDLKVQLDRLKLDSQMKLESMSQLNEKQEVQIQELHEHIIKIQKQKTKISNQHQFRLLVKKNQLQQAKDEYQLKEQQLRNVCNQNIRMKNAQIQKFSQKVSIQVQALISKHNRRVSMIQKEYSQLKKIMSEKTSLPEDVEALKVFYAGYLQLEGQLETQTQMKQNVQRQLQAKCAIQKVFLAKSFLPKPQDQLQIKITTLKQFYNKDAIPHKFKSNKI